MFYEEDRLATPGEAMQEFARNVGYEDRYINSQWILTDFDVWVVNPHYNGPPQPHPEEMWEGTLEEYAEMVEEARLQHAEELARRAEEFDDSFDCPF